MKEASGKITVPMSRPSATRPGGEAKARWRDNSAVRTSGKAATREANELYAKNFAVVALPGIATRLKHVPSDYEQRLVKNDFAWMAQNRDAILAEWQKRYANKSEAKK